jgi:hypothetical protein
MSDGAKTAISRRRTRSYMAVIDSYLFEIGWLFFAAWSVLVAIFLVTAFGRDFATAIAERGRSKSKDSCQIVDAAGVK